LAGIDTSETFGRKNVGSVVSELADEFAAFLGTCETEQRAISFRRHDKAFDESLLVQIHETPIWARI
jgi:hypothetical protein